MLAATSHFASHGFALSACDCTYGFCMNASGSLSSCLSRCADDVVASDEKVYYTPLLYAVCMKEQSFCIAGKRWKCRNLLHVAMQVNNQTLDSQQGSRANSAMSSSWGMADGTLLGF